MTTHQQADTAKTLAGLADEVLDSATLMAHSDSGSGDEAPRVSQPDHKLDVNGSSAAGETLKVGNEFNGDGISLLVDVHQSLEDFDGSGEKTNGCRGVEEEGEEPEHLHNEMNADENVAEEMEDDTANDVDTSGEDANDLQHVYSVGDFVWGKIKSHPWWPGRVYDASNASSFAVKYNKYNQTGRHLVAYFGDGSFSWCLPSQLIPFVDNFESMAKQSNSKSFLYAVEMALDEISVLVELGMTCQCISEGGLAGLGWPLAVNAGIKGGVPVPEGNTVRDSLSLYEPAEILSYVKHHAKSNSMSNLLESAVLKSWLSAFYRAKCGRPLPLYCEPLQVEGLEDKKNDLVDDANDQVDDANNFSKPIEVPIQASSEEERISSSKSGPGKTPLSADDNIYHRRKQKSVAELMGDRAKSKGRKRTIEDSTPAHVETSPKKRKMSGEQASGHTGSSRSADGKRVRKNSDNSDLAKKKELRVSIPERDGLGDQQNIDESPLSSRERKKSKYLSPPYTSISGKSSSKKEFEVESQKISGITSIGERMTKAARLILSPDANNGNKGVQGGTPEQFNGVKSARIGEHGSMNFATMDMNLTVNEVLSEVQSTALNPLYLRRNGSLEKTKGFICMFRHSNYLGSGNVLAQNDTNSPVSAPSHAQRRVINSVEAEKTKLKKAGGASNHGTDDEGFSRKTILMVTFSPGFSLPAKDEIINIYNKFGNLNKKETKVLYNSNCVQIVYRRGSDAEEAFKESIRNSPFGAAKVNFRLRHPLDASKTPGSDKSPSIELPLSSLTAGKGKSPVQLIKQKLKMMPSILEKCHGKITEEEKSDLEGEIKGLLEKLSTVASTNP